MIPIAVLEKFYYVHRVHDMTSHSSKSNKLRNRNTVRGRTGSIPVKKRKIYCRNRVYHKLWIKQTRLKQINITPKMVFGCQTHYLILLTQNPKLVLNIKGKDEQNIVTNNEITDDKPS